MRAVLKDEMYDEMEFRLPEFVQELAEQFGYERTNREALRIIAGIVRETAEWLESV